MFYVFLFLFLFSLDISQEVIIATKSLSNKEPHCAQSEGVYLLIDNLVSRSSNTPAFMKLNNYILFTMPRTYIGLHTYTYKYLHSGAYT